MSEEGANACAQIVAVVEGNLDLEVLTCALRKVCQRHEILRTQFQRLPGMSEPLQVVAASAAAQLNFEGASATGEAPPTVWVADDAAPLAAGGVLALPLTARVARLSPERHVLTLSLSALCADAVGLENLVREVSQEYGLVLQHATAASTASSEDEVLQYVVVSDWLNETLEAEDAQVGAQFWRNQLSRTPGSAACLARPAVGTFRPSSVAFTMDSALTTAVEQCAARLGASPASLLTAAWQTLLWRLEDEAALPVAALIDGRSTSELETALGPLARHLPLTSTLTGDVSFATAVARAHSALQDAQAWQECYEPHALLEADARAGSRCLAFVFGYRSGHPTCQAGNLTVRVIDTLAHAERFALLLSCVRETDATSAKLHYDPRRYSAADAQRLARRFQVLVESSVQNAQLPLAALRILPAEEERALLVGFNATARAYAGPQVVQQLFEAQVERTPDRTALSFEGELLSYRELDARSNRLARLLQRRGVGPNVPVGILMERSLDMVVAILGTLKAGGAYVPLDAEYPEDRLAYMLADSRAPVLVTHERLLQGWSTKPSTVICLDADQGKLAEEDARALAVASKPDDLAYVLYTSGSTGRPKGVAIPHRALCNHMSWMQERFPLGADDSVLQKTPFSFDASVWEFYAPLFAGARLVMARPGGQRDTAYLRDVIVQERITTLQVVPTLLQMLLDQAGFDTSSIARMFCGGEALSTTLRDRFYRVARGELINLYGPTETCIDASYHVCDRAEATVPIGRPIANTQIYLLDERQAPVPLGVPGELYIAGLGVGLGYLHNPVLTSERFLADPFSATPGASMYRTGDLGRYLPDGSIEYLGRADTQIKLRGHRIELSEIEACLARHPLVQQCAVVVREDQPGDKRLSAYYVPRSEEGRGSSDLRAFLKVSLPDYMVPVSFSKLAAFPLLPNGKIDQRGLPAPSVNAGEAASGFVAPRNSTERAVAQIWSEVLNVPEVGLHDDFFELGGHSLIATQLTSRIRKVFDVDLPLRELFAAPTVLGVAERISKQQAELAEQGDMDEVLSELEELSDEEAKHLLSQQEFAAADGE